MKPSPLNLLLALAKNPAKKTTIQLAGEIGVSQQTVSRWLLQLQRDGMVEKTPAGYRLTNQALKTLAKLSEAAEETKNRIEIQGTAVEGLKDGAYYMSLEGYRKQIKKKLGFMPYPGTLNLKISGKTDLENSEKLHSMPAGIKIAGFKDNKLKRFFGGAKCFKAKINDSVEGAVIIPDRTHHNITIIEIIAPVFLRKTLNLKNDSTAKITVFENETN